MAADNADEKKQLRHLAIIMDGNGRWAAGKGLKRIEGHIAGEKTVRRVMDLANEFGIEYLTLYAFSTENWNRSPGEVADLMKLLGTSIEKNIDELHEGGVRIRLLGRISGLPLFTRKKLMKAVERTAENTNGTLVLALNYGGRAEIADTAKAIAERVKAGEIQPSAIDEKLFSEYMYAPDIPDPDLLIRTSGEYRISNFLIWEISYTELYFTDTLWPDFGRDDFLKALESYKNRQRRFGGRKC